MAGLFLAHRPTADAAAEPLAAARAQFTRHGFGAPRALAAPGWDILAWESIAGGPESLWREGEDFIAVAGTLVYDGRMGGPALSALLRDSDLPRTPDWSRIGGQFVALVKKHGRLFAFTDYFGAFQLFVDREHRLCSTSLLAALCALPSVAFDTQGLYEFAFNVVPIGDDTVFRELRTLNPGEIAEFTPAGITLHATPKPLPDTAAEASIDRQIAAHRDRLMAVVEAHVRHFGNHVHCPLSGGIDSRLLLAALRAAGSTPHVYVYGPPDSGDVAVARAIGRAEGFSVEWIDKQQAPLDADAFAERTRRNFHEFDALPTYGNIFDNGGNAAARDARHAGGGLATSGGCGEIYRDFFYLSDRPRDAAAVAGTFFARFTRGDATPLFDPKRFLDRIAGKIALAAEADTIRTPIARLRIEHLYPRVRCRALFGREISIEARYGAYMMPFLDHAVVAEAMTLPIGMKRAGRFESALLSAIDPALARHMSAYGHSFDVPPGRAHRLGEWSSRIRPTWLRARSYAIRRRLGPMGDEHGGLLTPDYMARVVDPDFPAMRRYFRMENITDSGLWRRIACLEYLAQHLGSRLRH
ncbi:hypothetical protein [Stakelama saccharophila]|uniref:Asparagine synthase n=1 Tax=Stakelama saccharophila TaxID=3075605 RepID=A0ABZ0B7A0_9SPHN|nr:hypothetical protein [Stakelama sp. W311]WNO53300.1 hypothetical protein RPR59_12730 [Stakelama sp. W311]